MGHKPALPSFFLPLFFSNNSFTKVNIWPDNSIGSLSISFHSIFCALHSQRHQNALNTWFMGLKNRMPSMVCNLIGKWWNHFIVHSNKRMLIDQTGERNILSHHHRQQGLTMWGGSTRHTPPKKESPNGGRSCAVVPKLPVWFLK
jgi:hypothetical protein